MAKQKVSGQLEAVAENGAGEIVPVAGSTNAVALPQKAWLVRPVSGARPEQVVHADTLEDAIRSYNGDRSNYTRKQLEIVEG